MNKELRIGLKDELRAATGMMLLAVLELDAPTLTDAMEDFAIDVGIATREWVEICDRVPYSIKMASLLVRPWTNVLHQIITDAQSTSQRNRLALLEGTDG